MGFDWPYVASTFGVLAMPLAGFVGVMDFEGPATDEPAKRTLATDVFICGSDVARASSA